MIVNDLRKDLFEIKKLSPRQKNLKNLRIFKVFIKFYSQIYISFDNVIGEVGASKGYFEYMIFGLVLSVILTGALATYLANYIQKHLWIAYVGLLLFWLSHCS